MLDSSETLVSKVSKGNVFLELSPLEVPRVSRARRSKKRDIYPKAVEARFFQPIVKRKRLFDSRVDAAATFGSDGVVAIANNGSLNINGSLFDPDGALWMVIPETSFFVDAVQATNEYSVGSFYSGASNRQDRNNYDLQVIVNEFSSTNSVIKISWRFINRTGASVNMGCVLGMRYIVNSNNQKRSLT